MVISATGVSGGTADSQPGASAEAQNLATSASATATSAEAETDSYTTGPEPLGLTLYGSNGKVIGSTTLTAVYDAQGLYVGSVGIDPSTGDYSSWNADGVESDLTQYLLSDGLASVQEEEVQQDSTGLIYAPVTVVSSNTAAVDAAIESYVNTNDAPAAGADLLAAQGTAVSSTADFATADHLIGFEVLDQYGEAIGDAISGYFVNNTQQSTIAGQQATIASVYTARGVALGTYGIEGGNFETGSLPYGATTAMTGYLEADGFSSVEIGEAVTFSLTGTDPSNNGEFYLTEIEQALQQYLLAGGGSPSQSVIGLTDVYNDTGSYVGSYGVDTSGGTFATWNEIGAERNSASALTSFGISSNLQFDALQAETEIQQSSVQSGLVGLTQTLGSISSALANAVLSEYAPGALYDANGNVVQSSAALQPVFDPSTGAYAGSLGIDVSTGNFVEWTPGGAEVDLGPLKSLASVSSSSRQVQDVGGPDDDDDDDDDDFINWLASLSESEFYQVTNELFGIDGLPDIGGVKANPAQPGAWLLFDGVQGSQFMFNAGITHSYVITLNGKNFNTYQGGVNQAGQLKALQYPTSTLANAGATVQLTPPAGVSQTQWVNDINTVFNALSQFLQSNNIQYNLTNADCITYTTWGLEALGYNPEQIDAMLGPGAWSSLVNFSGPLPIANPLAGVNMGTGGPGFIGGGVNPVILFIP